MSKYIFLFVILTCVATSHSMPNWITKMGNLFQKFPENVAKAGQIVLGTISRPIIGQCTNVKSMMGMTFSKLNGTDKEPNFDEIIVQFMCPVSNHTYKLGTAARDIVANTDFDPSQKLYVFLHGWMSNLDTFNDTKNALFNTGNCNILAVDTTEYFSNNYLPQSSSAAFIGRKLAQVLLALNGEGLNPKDIHIIGHSLGAHVAGFLGKVFETLSKTKVGRITGLDPAGPCFMELDEAERLNHNDADFVDVIHSHAGLAGMEEAIGHVDFYPNGGGIQPGCMSLVCSHDRATRLFAESVKNPDAFLAVRCDSWNDFKKGECVDGEVAPMGFGATSQLSGVYYLQTGRNSPFGLEISGTKYDRYLSFDM